MPRVVSDIIDVYVFRRLNARVQFLLLQRKAAVPMGNTWQAFHTQVHAGEMTKRAIGRAVEEMVGLRVSDMWSADFINQFYDDGRDATVLSPVFAVNVSPQSPVRLGPEFRDAAWFDRDEATARLAFTGQRWAVRHIDEIMSLPSAEHDVYRLDASTSQPRHETESEASDLDAWNEDSVPLDEDTPVHARVTDDHGIDE